MMKMMLALLLCSSGWMAMAQTPVISPQLDTTHNALRKRYLNTKNGLQLNLNESGSHYIKFTLVNQVWIRDNQNNPGTTVNGQPTAIGGNTFDIGIRRYRIQVFGKLTDRVFVYTQMGENSITFQSERKFGFFVLDAISEYAVIPGKVGSAVGIWNIGAGITGWQGGSRFSSPAVGAIMGLDPPIFQQYGNDVNDQFGRKFSVYSHGTVGKLHFRVAAGKPFIVNSVSNPTIPGGQTSVPALGGTTIDGVKTNIAAYSVRDPALQYQGYFVYQFLDKEDFLTPYNTGTYLGNKRILSIGGGFVYQANAMWSQGATKTVGSGATATTTHDTVSSALSILSVDLFYDAPVRKDKEDAISFYVSFSHNNYGNNYMRMFNVMNPGDAKTTGLAGNAQTYNSGGGNSMPIYGTGNIVYSQLGYKFKKDLFGEEFGTLMPYASAQVGNYGALATPVEIYDIGINWLIRGHSSKITFDYQSRPFFEQNSTNTAVIQVGRYASYILQYQIAF